MCRLLGWVSEAPVTLAELLGSSALEEFTGLSLIHADGWGLAWLDEENQITRTRGPEAAHSSPKYAEAVTKIQSRAAIVHLRRASTGLSVCPENTHPFVMEGSAFAHNGEIKPFDGMSALLTVEQRNQLEGDTDSERYFALLSAARAEVGPVDGVRSAVAKISASVTASSLNAMFLNEQELTIISSHDPAAAPAPTGQGAADEQGYFELFAKTGATSIVVASSAWGRRGWDRLPNGHMMRVDVNTRSVETDEIGV
jgi:predicted glutamine amidotransferase